MEEGIGFLSAKHGLQAGLLLPHGHVLALPAHHLHAACGPQRACFFAPPAQRPTPPLEVLLGDWEGSCQQMAVINPRTYMYACIPDGGLFSYPQHISYRLFNDSLLYVINQTQHVAPGYDSWGIPSFSIR